MFVTYGQMEEYRMEGYSKNNSLLSKGMDTNAFNFPPNKASVEGSIPVLHVIVVDDVFLVNKNIMKPYSHHELTT